MKEKADAFERTKRSFLPKGRNLVEIDMKFALKSIVAAAAFVAVGSASAASTTVNVGGSIGGLTLASGSGTLSFSADLLSALSVGGVTITSYSPGVATTTSNADGYTSGTAAAPVTSLVVDSVTNQIQSVATAGGAIQTSPVVTNISSGGSLTVADLNVDLINKKVFATVIGGNGVGTLSNYYLWDIVNPVTLDTLTAGTNTLSTVSGLQITTAGYNTFIKSLGLYKLGVGALSTISDYGTITTQLTVTTAAVPEPSTYGLMALGMVGIGLVARRRRAA